GDAFVSKLRPAGSGLDYSTYLGGGKSEGSTTIAAGGSGAAYAMGDTQSENFPIKNALQRSYHGPGDAFVSKLATAAGQSGAAPAPRDVLRRHSRVRRLHLGDDVGRVRRDGDADRLLHAGPGRHVRPGAREVLREDRAREARDRRRLPHRRHGPPRRRHARGP